MKTILPFLFASLLSLPCSSWARPPGAPTLPSATAPGPRRIRVCGQAVELCVAQVSDSTFEIVIAPLDADGAAHLPSRPDALVAYPCREIWRGRIAQDPVVIPARSLTVQISAAPVTVSVLNRTGELVQRLAWQEDGAMIFKTEAPVFGLGQGGGGMDRRGRVQSLADGYFAGDDTSRIISPILIGADGWALFLPDLQEVRDHRSTRKAGLLGEFDLRNGQGIYRSHDVPRAQRLFLICADEPSQIMADLNRLTGQAALPPRWALGYMQSHRTLSGWDEILQVARNFREKNLPCDALIYLSEVYCKSGWGNGIAPFAWNTRNFPDPAANIAALHGLGYKVVLHVSRYPPSLHGVNLAKTSEDPAHVGNYWKLHHALHELGVDAWWPDDGEDLVTAGRFARH
ncbi:MAG: hypothetical protein FJ276_33230, partial [Planctomycetes bacterium]|nr:hypothetical protein [Planctomycetota bacterium]